jgi:hypothetical protein
MLSSAPCSVRDTVYKCNSIEQYDVVVAILAVAAVHVYMITGHIHYAHMLMEVTVAYPGIFSGGIMPGMRTEGREKIWGW